MAPFDADFLIVSRDVFKAGTLTLQDIRQRVHEGAAGVARRDMLSDLDTLARLFDKPLHTILARPAVLRDLFKSRNPVQLGISAKRYANMRSSVLAAVRAHGGQADSITRRVPLSPGWAELVGPIEKASYRFALYRLASYCSAMGISPADVDAQTLLGFHAALEGEEVVKDPRRLLKHTIAHWNMCGRTVAGWPSVRLSSPFKKEPLSLPLTAFPVSFQADVARWQLPMLEPSALDPLAPARPLRRVSVENRTGHLVRFASVLIREGHLEMKKVTELRDLVALDRVKAGLNIFLKRLGNVPSMYLYAIAQTLMLVAKHHCKVEKPHLAELQAICRRLDSRSKRDTPKRKRERLAQFDEPENVARLLRFPSEERARGLAQKNPYRAAKFFERATAAAILNSTCVRIQNLRTIDLETDLRWAGGKCFLGFEAEKVKNRQALEFELPPDVAALIEEYRTTYRQRLPGSEGPYLFPGRDGGPRPYKTMASDFGGALWKRAGLTMNPHLIRSAIGKIIVERDPGAYVAVSQMLGHKRIDMTLAHYLGTESRVAAKHVDKLLRAALKNPKVDDE